MIRIATVGTSMITGRFATAVHACSDTRLECVYSRDTDRARDYAGTLGARRWSSNLTALLGDGEIDAVYLASPNAVHHDQALQVIAAGKHVLVEKPATTSAADTAELVTAARERGVVFLEGIRSLYDPGFELLRQLLPRVGTVRRVSLRFHQRSARYDLVLAGERVNVFDPAMGGGALFDLGVYCVQPLVELFGEPRQVLALAVPIAGGADGAGAALVGYDGFVADLSYSKITLPGSGSCIEGEAGTILIDHLDDPRLLSVLTPGGTREEFVVRKDGTDKLANIADLLRRFVAAVKGSADITADQERSVLAARVLDRIRQGSGTEDSSRQAGDGHVVTESDGTRRPRGHFDHKEALRFQP